jgi:polyhydroxyalkanoate synthesis regulator protein
MKIVYRYGNRRLYCADEKKMINTSDLFNWVMAKEPFKVVCHKTKNDITQAYMARAEAYQTYKKVYSRGLI